MNKKIKVIDLLNKRANGEEMPKKIKYNNVIYEFNIDFGYINKNNYGADDYLLEDVNGNTIELNNEVEIIEESEQEIDIQAIEEINWNEIGYKLGKIFKELEEGILKGVKDAEQLDKKIKDK